MENNSTPTWKTAAIESFMASLAEQLDGAIDATVSLSGPQRMSEIFNRCVAASALVKATQAALARPD